VGTEHRPAKAGDASAKIYRVEILPKAQKELERIPKKQRKLVEDTIESLARNPRPAKYKPLKGMMYKGLCRVRSGDYRVIYQIRDDVLVVTVVTVGNRKDVYR
jgi:mRNA interferase RelE/StbE